MFTEARAVGRQNPRGYLEGHASKGQESDLGHHPSCFIRKHRNLLLVDHWKRELCRGCQQSPTLIEMPVSVDSKPFTRSLSPLDATLMKNSGQGSGYFQLDRAFTARRLTALS